LPPKRSLGSFQRSEIGLSRTFKPKPKVNVRFKPSDETSLCRDRRRQFAGLSHPMDRIAADGKQFAESLD
jgi:hypothetical protein